MNLEHARYGQFDPLVRQPMAVKALKDNNRPVARRAQHPELVLQRWREKWFQHRADPAGPRTVPMGGGFVYSTVPDTSLSAAS